MEALVLWGFRYVSCTISFADDYGYLPAKGPARFRAYIIAGLNDSWQHFAASEVNKPWLGGLQAMGGDIVIIGLPAPPPCWFKNGGYAYRAAFLAKFARIKGLAENTYGNPPQALVVGISYGGLHALYIYAAQPRAYIGWQAALPVTHLNRLEEYGSLGALPGFDAFAVAPSLRASRGYVAWAGKDIRTGIGLGEAFYRAARGQNVVGIPFPNLGHVTTPAVVDSLLKDAKRLTQPQ